MLVGPGVPVEPVASSSARLVPVPLPLMPKLLRLTPQPDNIPAIKSNRVLNRTLGDKACPHISITALVASITALVAEVHILQGQIYRKPLDVLDYRLQIVPLLA